MASERRPLQGFGGWLILLFLNLLLAGVAVAQSAPPRKDIPTISKAANGTVVSIIMSDKNGQPIAQGSGFFISRDGEVVTNYHVIRQGKSAVVKLPDGAFFVVDGVLAVDKDRDIAIVKAHGTNFRTVTLGDSAKLQVGEEVIAIGNPLSLESTVSNGIVSGIRDIEDEGGKFLQITAPISPGSSGGPLFNMAGEVVGVTSARLRDEQNLNFAIPINDVKHVVDAYKHLRRSGFSVVGNFPDEAETSRPPTANGAELASKNPSARDYYMQLYDAGGFFRSISATGSDGKPEVLTVLNTHYVCFNDSATNADFFTFDTMAYDERYAKAYATFVKGSTTPEEQQETSRIMESVKQDVPYVTFLDDTILGVFPSNAQAFLRQGGRVLNADFYRKGVKSGEVEYHWNGSAWVVQEPPDPSASFKTAKVFRLSIEPTTLRYIEHVTITNTVGSGETVTTASSTEPSELGSGTCEEIPDKRPN